MKSFVEFYESEKISPVSQDISDETKHFRRRDALYRCLGIPPRFIQGATVIEFGPGSGFNSIHTATYAPKRYVLVEGNRYGLQAINDLFSARKLTGIELVHSRFETYRSAEKFDLVCCEGALPVQPDPIGLLVNIASHTALGGLVVITTQDALGYMPEIIRRFVARFLVRDIKVTADQVERLLPELGSHLSTMKGMSRPHNDWILDNILQPFAGRELLGISEAVEALSDKFSVHGSSPRFLTEWSWYKDLTDDPRAVFNPRALSLYWQYLHNFLDYTCTPQPGDPERNKQILAVANEAYTLCLDSEIVHFDWGAGLAKMKDLILQLIDLINAYQMEASKALEDACHALEECVSDDPKPIWGRFTHLFGRGQQYLSLMRHG